MTYYLYHNEEQRGPFMIGQIRGMWNSGAVTADVLFWASDSVEWRPLAEIASELDGTVIAPPPVPVAKPRHPRPEDAPGPGKVLVRRDGVELGWFTYIQIRYKLETCEFDWSEHCLCNGMWYDIDFVIRMCAPPAEAPAQPMLAPAAPQESRLERAAGTYLYTEALIDIFRLFRG